MTIPTDHLWVTHCNERLSDYAASLAGPSKRLNEAMAYVLQSGGKRLRALLVYLIGEHFQVPSNTLDPIALAIECVHAFSLVHDDLPAMDDDDWRRHQPTCHKAFDEATAILCGDALLSEAFTLLATSSCKPSAIVLMIQQLSLAIGVNGLCGGQSLDMQATADKTSTEDMAVIHAHKTGALFAAACELPYLASDKTDSNTQHHLRELGYAIGHCLQISDDMLDLSANQEELGKTPGKDNQQNKASYSNLLSFSECAKHCNQWQAQANTLLEALNMQSPALHDVVAYLCNRANREN